MLAAVAFGVACGATQQALRLRATASELSTNIYDLERRTGSIESVLVETCREIVDLRIEASLRENGMAKEADQYALDTPSSLKTDVRDTLDTFTGEQNTPWDLPTEQLKKCYRFAHALETPKQRMRYVTELNEYLEKKEGK